MSKVKAMAVIKCTAGVGMQLHVDWTAIDFLVDCVVGESAAPVGHGVGRSSYSLLLVDVMMIGGSTNQYYETPTQR